jgi:LacI family gluconate utilization system Gnt-I transcriptional repressor
MGAGELIDSGLKAGAIFCSSDTIANGVIIEATARGLSIPDDLAIIGFGDQSFAAYTFPALSTVRIDRAEMGRKAADAMMGRIDGTDDVKRIIDIGFQIIERNTT